MLPDDIINFLHRRPFEPFRIHLTDGTTYEVRHPEFVLVGRATTHVYFPVPDMPPPRFEKYEVVSLLHITRLEPMEASAAPAAS
jgi:hypothetical protein